MKRHPIAWQAASRLVLSLGLFVVLVAATSAGLYRLALQQAANERAEDLVVFYKARLAEIDRDWEIQGRDFRVRLEFTRFLERPATATVNLQAFITIQGTSRGFDYLLIQTRQGQKLFETGKNLTLASIPLATTADSGFYLDASAGRLYRVYQDKIWLGDARGMGRMAVFYALDNALLNRIGAPGVTLTLIHHDQPIASSGAAAMERLRAGTADDAAQTRVTPWAGSGVDDSAVTLRIEAPVKTLFTTTELMFGASVIPLVDGLILWFVLGRWLLRQTRRVTDLGRAVSEFSSAQKFTETMEQRLTQARGDSRDEIAEVAEAVSDLAHETLAKGAALERHQRHLEEMVQARTAELNRANQELKQAHARERELAWHDVLTALPNRKLFLDRLTHALTGLQRYGQSLAVMFIDIDGFKEINDELGHAAGDHVLREVATRLVACVRNSDTVSRWGGDEFTVLLLNVEGLDVTGIAKNVLARLSEAHALADRTVCLGASLGIAFAPRDGDSADRLLQCADAAMYQAKHAGGGVRQWSAGDSLPGSRSGAGDGSA